MKKGRLELLPTITEQWKYETKGFHIECFFIYPKRNILFECIPINFDFSVHSKIYVPKVTKSFFFFFFFFLNQYIDIHTGAQENRIVVAPFLQGET